MGVKIEKSGHAGDTYRQSRKNLLKRILTEVSRMLRTEYLLDLNTANKILKSFFADDFLPLWYFYSNRPEDIAGQIFIITQMMSPAVEYLEQVSEDGKAISYILNVGKDYPGKLARIIRENLEFGVVAYDSVKTLSGVRIITLENSHDRDFGISDHEKQEIDDLVEAVGRSYPGESTVEFLHSLPLNYLYEECKSLSPAIRLVRHLNIFKQVIESEHVVLGVEDTVGEADDEKLDSNEKRIYLGVKNPDKGFVLRVLEVFEERGINLNRSYYDTFAVSDGVIGIMSVYARPNDEVQGIEAALEKNVSVVAEKVEKEDALGNELEVIIRRLSGPLTAAGLEEVFGALKLLVDENTRTDNTEESKNFLLNSFSDFLRAAEFLGIDEHFTLMQSLLGFDSLNAYYVGSTYNGKKYNLPGFRAKHNAMRGIAYKGGLRIDPIVDFVEVAALAFMMTWKCARAKILFGGAKGGLILDRSVWRKSRMDYFDTLANFGSALFLVTGPSEDVPAGDVGCGPAEIGHLFEGFKTTLRELALLSSGIKRGVARIGNKIISVERANKILGKQFDIDVLDEALLDRLVTSEEYLELVTAAQITGKPKMGIEARTGATGRGLCYAILATVTKLYLAGEWEAHLELTEDEDHILKRMAGLTEKSILEHDGDDLISDEDWRILDEQVYPKLFKHKRVVIQGSGKVGSSIMRELDRYGVNIIAVADAGGAVIGENFDVDDLIGSVMATDENTIMQAATGVTHRIPGAREGSQVLELPCDILIPAALENAITAENALALQAKIVACGSNGTTSSKAEILLEEKEGTTVIYDFLANGGGVTASYFEWLRNLHQRHRYEAEVIYGEKFDIGTMDVYIMPEFRTRIKNILSMEESRESTAEWNKILRDIMICAVNEDYDFAKANGISLRAAGFVNSQMRVISAHILSLSESDRTECWRGIPEKAQALLKPFLLHPETRLFSDERDSVINRLYG